ncbi:hypothetical protein [Streptomyces sp. NPDC002132]|uniref:hypothetical protein n=1 Tax=unclassified Streptomyces TaxID=2593676 RepID=UPI00331DFFB0
MPSRERFGTAPARGPPDALARAGTVAAVRLLALAFTEADDNQADWIQIGGQDALADGAPPDVAAVLGPPS